MVIKVFDNTHPNDLAAIPLEMGTQRADQLQGTGYEKLVELAGRVCYDSLGAGRDSAGYHEHIRQVNHGSVWEHVNLTFFVKVQLHPLHYLSYLCNRPGVYVTMVPDSQVLRFTVNLRSIREWDKWGVNYKNDMADNFWKIIYEKAREVAPMILEPRYDNVSKLLDHIMGSGVESVNIIEPAYDDEIWVSFYLSGSRGWSHEMVRHGDFTAISQRSTRYVDESESRYTWHPLIKEYLDGMPTDESRADGHILRMVEEDTKAAYDAFVTRLQTFAEAKGHDKLSSRKQARGAARGLLCNALSTEMIFSASLTQWKRMIEQRLSPAADGEICEIFKGIKSILAADYHT